MRFFILGVEKVAGTENTDFSQRLGELRVVWRHAMPCDHILHKGDPLAFHGVGDDAERFLNFLPAVGIQRLHNLRDGVPVDAWGLAAECIRFLLPQPSSQIKNCILDVQNAEFSSISVFFGFQVPGTGDTDPYIWKTLPIQ